MPSDYDSIRADNIREYGEGTRHLSFLGRLYTDRTHFIFELLQNAEDAGAAKILFELFEDRLEVKHDGRPFNELDVRGVCGVGEGTKAEDLTQIGTFGIGFKSVYACTSAPEVHSGEEHFRIEHYVRPYKAATKVPGDSWTTLFVFAFDAPGIEPQTAMHEIAERLRNLSARTLLFLRKIEEIGYKLLDNQGGFYLRDKPVPRDKARQVNVIGQNNGQNEDENWLVFDRPLSVPDPHKPDRAKTVWVEIGFKLETNTKDQTERIVRIKESPLVVYFPTEKSTRFGFLIQGPYKTTPSRDNIPKGDDWNTKLVKETTLLLVDTLQRLKKMGLLTVALLNALPIRMDDFPEDGMFYPIVKAVRNALMDQELLPANEGTFVSARNAKLARGAELRKLLTHDQLGELFQSKDDIRWLSGEITENKTVDLYGYLKRELKIDEVRPKSEWGATGFAEMITPSFIEKQSDEWMIVFYEFLYGQESLWENEYSPLRNKPFIRLQDGTRTHVSPFKKDGSLNAYLPPEGDTEFPVVKREIAKDEKALEFLKKLGLTEPGAVAEVIRIIPKYTHDNPQISDDKHLRDMKKILHAYSTEDSQEKKSLLTDRLADTAFINAENPVLQQMEYKKPGQLYFQNEDLLLYFEGNKDAWFVSSEYDACFYDLFKDLGITDTIRIRCKSKNGSAEYVKLEYKNGYRRGLKGFDPDIHVDGLEDAIRNPSTEGKEIIWNKIAIKYSHCIKGKVLRSSRQDFSPNASTYKEDEITTNFGHLLIDKTWLPSPDGSFVRPNELSLDDLPIEFEKDTPRAKSLSLAMSMKQPEHEQALEVVTEGDPDLKMLIEHYQSASDAERKKILKSIPSEHPPEPASSFKEGLKKLGRRQRGTPQHGGTEGSPVSDTDRYQDKLKEDVEQEVAKYQSTSQTISFSPVRDRFINAEARDFLYEQYHGRCQVTGTTFPKASRNINDVSENYFESCALLSYTNAGYLNDAGNMLCVSADTMAKFKCASIEFLDSLEDTIESFKLNSGQVDKVSVRIRLAGEECSIKWTQRHFMRLIALYEKA